MDLVITKKYQIHLSSLSLSPIESPPNSILEAPPHSANASFPILAVAIIGILATAILLVSYYIFVIKCCLNWHRIDLLSRFSFSGSRRNGGDPWVGLFSPRVQRRGLEESIIQAIPTVAFKKERECRDSRERSFDDECAVCLNEFQEGEKLRKIPNCFHVFHVDCIDVWLQGNVNCPLCRTSVSTQLSQFPLTPPHPNTSDNFTGRDEDYVVIELGRDMNPVDRTLLGAQERSINSKVLPISPFRKKSVMPKKASHFVSSKGDECIDTRGKDDRFAIQPMRRSFSMDSANDRQLYLAVQEIIQQKTQVEVEEISPSEGCSGRVRKSIFSFGNGRGSSRSAVLPIELEP